MHCLCVSKLPRSTSLEARTGQAFLQEKRPSCPWKCSGGTKIQQSLCSSVSKDWVVISSRKDSHLSSKCSAGKTIQLILVDDSNGHERHSLDVGSSHLIVLSTLKVWSNNYAQKKDINPRSLIEQKHKLNTNKVWKFKHPPYLLT